ncbi:hypothetical protein WMF20_29215 [Sorangium sp. So ce834]|uniref:hypothetical protein n=1 Tax=Sorangium sp. So ce834 TaxID=3133321 RepID=UPI003F5FEF98
MKRCYFCDCKLSRRRGGNVAMEHVIPDWLQSHLGFKNYPVRPKRIGFDEEFVYVLQSPTREEFADKERPLSILLQEDVCGSCNNGWMSDLERAVAPHLVALVDATRDVADLDSEAAMIVARWALKTALALDSADPFVRYLPKEHARSVRVHANRLPEGVAVFGTNRDIERHLLLMVTKDWPDCRCNTEAVDLEVVKGLVRSSYKALLGLGHLLLLVVYWPPRQGWRFVAKDMHHLIWANADVATEHDPELPPPLAFTLVGPVFEETLGVAHATAGP